MVPRGVKVKHDFLMVNRLGESITILNLRPSCGCTSGRASASQVGPGQSAVIEAEMDTRNFVGPKSTILYVTFITASGREGEARLGVSSKILSDIVMKARPTEPSTAAAAPGRIVIRGGVGYSLIGHTVAVEIADGDGLLVRYRPENPRARQTMASGPASPMRPTSPAPELELPMLFQVKALDPAHTFPAGNPFFLETRIATSPDPPRICKAAWPGDM